MNTAVCKTPGDLRLVDEPALSTREKGSGPFLLMQRTLAALRVWAARARQRRDLGRLDGRLLRDIGVTPFDVERETGKPVWRA